MDDKDRLVAEIKNRAKGCISSRNFPEAVKLYSKAIENAEHDNEGRAILHANRSMCYLNFGNADDALADARLAQELDGTYAKSYYREAMALRAQQQYSGARAALLKGLDLKPDDKEMRAQLLKVEEELTTLKQKGRDTTNSKGSTTSSKSTNEGSTSTNTAVADTKTSTQASSSAAPAGPTVGSEDDDEDEDIGALNMRGYKKTSDGRTTTFFNRELDEESKRLIGDIAPKKIERVEAAALPAAAPSNGSVWNSAGTYEERILTPWASSRLSELMKGIKVTVPAQAIGSGSASGVSIAAVKVEGVTGDAQISMIRGKTKHICDFSLTLHWRMEVETNDGDDEAVEGKMAVADITADRDFEIGDVEVTQYKGNSCTASALPQSVSKLVSTYIKGLSQGLQLAVKEKLEAFCDEFKTK